MMPQEVPVVLTYDLAPQHPRLALPPGACDSHVHVFGPAERFAYAPGRRFTPVDAPKEGLFALHRQLGIDRCVIVQSVLHGLDNRVVEDAIVAGGGRYLGVALVPVDVPDAELERLAAAGFRGVRFNFMTHHAPGPDLAAVVALTHRLRPLGMHLQVHMESRLIHSLAPELARSAVPVVIDHMARVDAHLGPQHPDFAALLQWLGNPLFHVKVSGVDRIDPEPPYTAGLALAAALVQARPDQCLWGTDWPHPFHTHVPRDAQLVDLLEGMAPDAALRQRLLVDNPQRLYRFSA